MIVGKKKTPPDPPPVAKPKDKPLHPIAAANLTNRPRGRKR